MTRRDPAHRDIPPQKTAAGPDGVSLSEEVGEASRRFELADPDAGLSPVDRRINQVAEAVGVGVLVMITILIFMNASLRYLASTSFIWAQEITIGSIPWLAFIGLFLSVRRRRYIRIGFFVERLPPRPAFVLEVAAHVFSALVFAYLAWGAFSYIGLFGADRTTYLGLPKGVFHSALLIGAGAVAIAFVLPVRRRAAIDGSRL